MSTPPILIIKHGVASKSDIALARKAGVLVLVVTDPAEVRYMDPPLAAVTRLEATAVALIKEVMADEYGSLDHDAIMKRLATVFLEQSNPKPATAVDKKATP